MNLLIAILLAAGTSSAPEAGTTVPTFPTQVDVVSLDVTATDGRNRFVTGLSQGDFAVYENGAPQQLVLFAPGKLPLSISLLIDGSFSMQPNLPLVQNAALRLIRGMGPDDEGQVVQFNDRYRVLQGSTHDTGLLERAIQRVRAEGTTSLNTALYIALKEARRPRADEPPRRRALVLLSDGRDTSSALDEDRVLELARRAGVTIYPVRLGAPGQHEPDAGPLNYFLGALARETGGRTCFAARPRELTGAYERIAEELRTQYTLAYVSSHARADGRWRNIAIETSRAGVSLRHKVGYYPREAER